LPPKPPFFKNVRWKLLSHPTASHSVLKVGGYLIINIITNFTKAIYQPDPVHGKYFNKITFEKEYPSRFQGGL
jgi:hypothetical protein